MKKAITSILCLLLFISFFTSCESLGESRRKKKEVKLSQGEKDSLFFERLSSFVSDEDVKGFASIFEATPLQDVKRIINKKNKAGRTLLHICVLLENVELTRLILSVNPNKDLRDSYNKTAEDYARESKNKAILSLFGIKEEVSQKEPKKEVKKPKKETVEKGGSLVSVPITVDTVTYSYDIMLGETASPFLKAVKKQDFSEVEKLLDEGNNVNETDSLGNNAVFYALLNNNSQMLNLLIRRGINCDSPNNAGKYPLLYAVDRGDSNVIKALCDAGANVNVSDNEGLTAVMIAAYRKSVAILKLLNRLHVSFSVKDARGNTALHIAIQGEDVPTVKFLLKQIDVDVKEPNEAGVTPVKMMKNSKNSQIKRLAVNYDDDDE